MKQVLLSLLVVLCLCNCNSDQKPASCAADETKAQLLKAAGFSKMEKEFTYDYTIANDSAAGQLSLVPEESIISFSNEELSKGKLLNVFKTGGQVYQTFLENNDSSFVMRVMIDGVLIDRIAVVKPSRPPGTPPSLPCSDDPCGDVCTQACSDYFRRSIYPDLLARANQTCKPVLYCYHCSLGSIPCYYVLYYIKPDSPRCSIRFDPPVNLAVRKLSGGLRIKVPQKMQ